MIEDDGGNLWKRLGLRSSQGFARDDDDDDSHVWVLYIFNTVGYLIFVLYTAAVLRIQ